VADWNCPMSSIWRETMKTSAYALVLVGLLLAVSSFAILMNGPGSADAANTEPEVSRVPPSNKQTPYIQHTGWSTLDMDYTKPVNQRWHNWTNYLPYYPQTDYWLRCKNMTEDYTWLDDVNFTTNGEEFGLCKEDINLTQVESDPMNFTYPRSGQNLTALYNTEMNDMGVINLTINPLGLTSMGTNPLMGRGKQLMVDVWVDTNGDYDFEDPSPDAGIEGWMSFDFNWWDSPYDPLNPGATITPYTTNSSEMWKTQRQMEESMDGIGYWLDIDEDGRPNIPGDIKGGRIWVLIWRIDNQPDDFDNRTMDLILYCGYNQKLSWISLPFKHPDRIPHADTGSDGGFPVNRENFLLPPNHPDHEDAIFDDEHPQLKEGMNILFDGRKSYDPQDDVGLDGIGYGHPKWVAEDIGEANKNIDDGDPEGEDDYGETDTLVYKWSGAASFKGRDWAIPISTNFQKSPLFNWRVRLPALDAGMVAKDQWLIVNVTLTVRDRSNLIGTHTIKLLAYKSQNPPVVSLTVSPQIPKEFAPDQESYITPQKDIRFNGYAYDKDPNTELKFEWELTGPDGYYQYYEGFNIIDTTFDTLGDYYVVLTVFDGPKTDINTLSTNRTFILHVVKNIPPVPIIKASHDPSGDEWYLNEFNTTKNRVVYFNSSLSYDPDVFVEAQLNKDPRWQGLPGFDEDMDGLPEVPMKYQWEWGDNTRTEFSSSTEADHRWNEKGASSKQKLFWPVTLNVWDGESVVKSPEYRVLVNMPPTAEAGPNRPTPEEGYIEVGMPLTFNGIGSYDPNDDVDYDQKRDKDYVDRLNYTWDFGDGSPVRNGMTITYTYKKAGTFTVKLVVKDRGVGSVPDDDTCTVRIIPSNQAPVGITKITAESWKDINNREVYTKVKMTFDATDSYDPDGAFYNDQLEETNPLDDLVGLTWNLGDGTVSKQAKVIHTYDENGVYTVTINMTDKKGSIWEETHTITVANRLPVAVVKETTVSAKFKDQPLLFSGDGSYDEDGEVVGYYWDYGDGTHSPTDNEYAGYMPSKVTSHKYDKVGKYVVTLRVKDDDGATSPDDKIAVINVQVRPDRPIDGSPFPYLAVGIGVSALLVLLTVASSSFIWLRKRV